MIEAELKARLVDPDRVRARLDGLATGEWAQYEDRYFDTTTGDLESDGRELRIRSASTGVEARHVLTFKGTPVDEVSQSKPEYEVEVADPDAAGAVLEAMGYRLVLAFGKDCVNYRFTRGGRQFVASLVTVPELDGTYLEVETLAAGNDVADALVAVRAVMGSLGVGEGELTTDTYSGAVAAARSGAA